MADQLAFEVDPACALRIVERRGGEERALRVGPLAEPEARALAALPAQPHRGAARRRPLAVRRRGRGAHGVTRTAGLAADRPRRGPALGQQLGGDAVLLGLGGVGGIAGAAHLRATSCGRTGTCRGRCRRRRRRSGRRPTRTGRCAAACRRRRPRPPSVSLAAACGSGAAAVTPSAARVRGPATPSARQAMGALEALDGGPGLRAVDAVGADAELLLQRRARCRRSARRAPGARRRPGPRRRRRRRPTARRPASGRRGRAGRCAGVVRAGHAAPVRPAASAATVRAN